ncbi:MAG: MATE family efflux transporter [Butyricicoccus pullicaecorum]|nr:MATE family efflux transporter [Butyricicoccus pullicaecorum]
MSIKLSDHFTFRRLLRFTLPSIITMIFASVYSVVDGLFVSNLVGDLALSAVNIIFPVTMIVGAFGFMIGSGGSAIVAKTLGEGEYELANRYFSMFVYGIILVGALLSVACVFFVEPISRLAGASDLLIADCVAYGRIMLAGSVAFMLQVFFQSFFIVAEKPHLGLILSVAAGLTNMVFDYVLIAVCGFGVAGAALATVLGYCIGGILPLLYFLNPRRRGLRLTKTRLYIHELAQASANGSSELMSNLSSSVISILYNIQLMNLIGEAGVAAYSVMMYVDFVFVATFLGFSMGCGPIVSYHFGAANHVELKNVFHKSMAVIGVASLAMVLVSEGLSRPLSAAFVGYNPELLEITVHGFRLFAASYLFCGINIFASAFFTALCNGLLSALISFLRSFALRGGMVLLMPVLFGLDGIWAAVIAAEGAGAIISLTLLFAKRKQYQYM